MTQEEIDRQINLYGNKIWSHTQQIREIENEIIELRKKERKLDDPHVLIPKSYGTIEDWLKDIPFPELTRKSHTFRNKAEARDVQLSCNVFQSDYYIRRK